MYMCVCIYKICLILLKLLHIIICHLNYNICLLSRNPFISRKYLLNNYNILSTRGIEVQPEFLFSWSLYSSQRKKDKTYKKVFNVSDNNKLY